MRDIQLPGFAKAILSDTVGFVADLPTELVAAFRATLEEVLAADLILHVRDMAHPDSDAQLADVRTVLASLGVEEGSGPPLFELWNKIDLLDDDARAALMTEAARRQDAIPVSALSGDGLDEMTVRLSERLRAAGDQRDIELSVSDGERLAWLHSHGQIVEQANDGETTQLKVRLSDIDWARFQSL
jgi:GTP-binding protein HflX